MGKRLLALGVCLLLVFVFSLGAYAEESEVDSSVSVSQEESSSLPEEVDSSLVEDETPDDPSDVVEDAPAEPEEMPLDPSDSDTGSPEPEEDALDDEDSGVVLESDGMGFAPASLTVDSAPPITDVRWENYNITFTYNQAEHGYMAAKYTLYKDGQILPDTGSDFFSINHDSDTNKGTIYVQQDINSTGVYTAELSVTIFDPGSGNGQTFHPVQLPEVSYRSPTKKLEEITDIRSQKSSDASFFYWDPKPDSGTLMCCRLYVKDSSSGQYLLESSYTANFTFAFNYGYTTPPDNYYFTVQPLSLNMDSVGNAPESVKVVSGGRVSSTSLVTTINLSPTVKTLKVGGSVTLSPTVSPSGATNKAVTWSTSNKAVATVSSSGVVKGVKAGKVTITATAKDGSGVKGAATIYVGYPVTALSLSKTSNNLRVGGSFTLAPTVAPSNASNKTVTWSSSNTAVATVSSTGVVRGVKVGTATITGKTQDGGKTATCKVTVRAATTSVKISPTVRTVKAGASYTLKATIAPSTSLQQVTWSTSNKAVATVSSSGVVKGVKAGKVTITATAKDGSGKKGTMTLYIGAPVTGLKLNKTSYTLRVSKTFTLAPTFSPSNAQNKTITWTSSNTAVATVSSTGVVKGLKTGTATITAKTQDGSKTATCKVTVRPAVTGVSVSPTVRTIKAGSSCTITPTIAPSNAAIKTVKWTSSNSKVATVNTAGVVRGVTPGKVTITCTTTDGAKVAKATIYVGNPVTAVKLNTTSTNVKTGKSITLKPTFTPSNAQNKTITFTSSDNSVATVTNAGVVTGVKAGTVTITAKTQDGGKTATCKVRVGPSVTGVSLSPQSAGTIKIGGTVTLKASVLPSNAANKAVTWKSSSASIATVSTGGVVKGVKAGKATITCTTADGAKTAKVTVYVGTPVTGVTLNKTSLNMDAGGTYPLKATIAPSGATNKAVSWSSSNTAVATVSSGGVVTAKGAGTATITCATADGGKKAVCTVAVTQKQEYVWPVNSPKITENRHFNPSAHNGIDITSTVGDLRIMATKSGVVVGAFTGCNNNDGRSNPCATAGKGCALNNIWNDFCNYGSGNGVIVYHKDGTYAFYGHLASNTVSVGQSVSQGDVIGTMGNLGNATGVHTCFELRHGDTAGTINSYFAATPFDPEAACNGG